MRRLAWVLAMALLVLGGLVGARHRRLTRQLVERVTALSAPRPRPVHREPALDSTFEAQLTPLLDAPPNWGVFGPSAPWELSDNLKAVLEGRLPLESLDPQFERDAELPRAWVEKLMDCSRARASGEVEGQGLFIDRRHPHMQVSWFRPLQLWGPLEVRRVLARGEPERALQWCVDLLANTRDVLLLRGFGLEHATFMAKALADPCTEALKRASPEARAQFQGELRQVRAGVPSLRETMERQRAQLELAWFGGFLSSGQLAQVPALARPAAGLSAQGETSRRMAVEYLGWAESDASWQVLIDAADTPARDARFREELNRFHPWLWLADVSWANAPLERAHQYDEWLALFDRLAQPTPE